MKKIAITGLGMSVVDVIHVVPEFPLEEGVTESEKSLIMGGGPVPTALCAAAKLGSKTAIIDRVGDDWRGHRIVDEYQTYGVDTTALQLESGTCSAGSTVLVRKNDGARHVIFSRGNTHPLTNSELPLDLLKNTAFLHLNGRHWPTCIDAAKIVKRHGGKISFDGGANRFQEKFLELLPLIDIMIVAADFAEKFSPGKDRNSQVTDLYSLGAEIVGITAGEEGSSFITEQGLFHQPAYQPHEVIDTTGCGDVFHGAFLAAYASGKNAKEAAQIASAAASFNAEKLGGRGGLPSIQSALERIAQGNIIETSL